MLDKKTNSIKVVDLDSCSIEDNTPFLSKYLSPFAPINEFPTKYKSCEGLDYCLASYYPDENTDLYCYVMMIVNTIMGVEAYRLTKDDYFKYMEFLIKMGISKELVDIFADIYSIKNNINPKDLLDELIPQFDKLNLQNFNEFKRL